ncbi:MAG: peptidoglycan D,D-transpeptidase FtsI family protein [Acidimicrobiales bacterium]
MLLVLLAMTLIASGLTYRLVELQLRNAEEFVEIGRQQRFRTVQLAGGRGDILDRNGNSLATSLPSTSFFVDPKFVEDPIGDAVRLAPVLKMAVEDVRALLGGQGRFAWLIRQTSEAKAAEILALDVPGVFTTSEPDRFQPSGPALARSVIGNVDIDSMGLSGIEKIYDDVLQGQPGELSIEIGRGGPTIPGQREVSRQPVPGADVVLTIDRSLQFEVERVLTEQVDAMDAQGGVVLVSDPTTGEILAMASVVRNNEGEVASTSLNMATSWSYEPGSVMKALTFGSIIDAGIANSSSTSIVPDSYELWDYTFSDSSPHPTREMTVSEIVTVSSNVGTVRWAEQLGGARLDTYLRDFGFGSPANLGFPGETAGLMIPPDSWGGLATATTALGQGISVTPAQMLAAFNAVANDGLYVPLQMVREVVRSDGTNEVPPAPKSRQVISPSAAAQVRNMLESAVAVGTGVNAQVDGYRVAGKTGTARKPLENGQGYEDGAGNFRYIATFAGFLPADEPELSIIVTIDQPTASIYAGHVAAPVFADIASYAVRHFGIAPPPEIAAGQAFVKPDFSGPMQEERVVSEVAVSPGQQQAVEQGQGDASFDESFELDVKG